MLLSSRSFRVVHFTSDQWCNLSTFLWKVVRSVTRAMSRFKQIYSYVKERKQAKGLLDSHLGLKCEERLWSVLCKHTLKKSLAKYSNVPEPNLTSPTGGCGRQAAALESVMAMQEPACSSQLFQRACSIAMLVLVREQTPLTTVIE